MKRTFFYLTASLLMISIHISAQEIPQDSLLKLLTTARDTIRVNTLNDLADLQYRAEPAEAIEYGEEARELAEKLNYGKGLGYALKNIGLGYYMLGNYVEASVYWEQSLAAFESIQDEQGTANIIGNLGAVYSTLGDDAKAVEYFLRALSMAEDSGDSIRIATCLLNIGSIYSYKTATVDQSLPYYLKALQISEEIQDLDAVGISSFNLGDYYFQKEDFDSALLYFEKSLVAYGNTLDVAPSLNNIGRIYALKGYYQKAIQYQQEALEIAENADAKLEMAQAYLGLADTYQHQGNLGLAISHFEKAKNIAEEIESNYDIKDAYEGLTKVYAEMSDYRNAFRYQSLLRNTERSIYNIETDDQIKALQFSYQLDKKEDEIQILEQRSEIEQLRTKRQRVVSMATGATGILLLLLAIVLYNRFKFSQKTKKIIEEEKNRSDNLLLNILPSKTAEELKAKGKARARRYEQVTILFTDFKEFTQIAAGLDPEVLVKEINRCYVRFDEIITRYGIEKIKTIGDAYMAAGGLPVPNTTHALDVVKAAIEIRDFMDELKEERKRKNKFFFEIRIGIHTGPVVAGIVGIKKFAYDIWGDTVNIAARMESTSEPGKINLSECTYHLIEGYYKCYYRGEVEAKNRGKLKMYFLGEEKKEMQHKGKKAHVMGN